MTTGQLPIDGLDFSKASYHPLEFWDVNTDREDGASQGVTHFSRSHERQGKLVPELELLEGKLHGSFQALVGEKNKGRHLRTARVTSG